MEDQSYIKVLPYEVLLNHVFQKLTRNDIAECQRLSRLWYSYTNFLHLKTIKLKTNKQINTFIEYFINHIPHTIVVESLILEAKKTYNTGTKKKRDQ